MPSAGVAASPAEDARARGLIARNIVVSMHDHPVVSPEDIGQIFEQKRRAATSRASRASPPPVSTASSTT